MNLHMHCILDSLKMVPTVDIHAHRIYVEDHTNSQNVDALKLVWCVVHSIEIEWMLNSTLQRILAYNETLTL